MGATLEPLTRTGVSCSLVLSGPDLAVCEAEGACARLLGYEPRALLGLAPGRLLEGAAPLVERPEGACTAAALATARPLLAFWARTGERVEVLLLDAGSTGGGRADPACDFAGAAAHDLRNPLATVKLNLQVLARQPAGADERSKRRLAIALREVETLEQGLEALSECGRAGLGAGARADLPRVLGGVAQRLAGELGEPPRVRLEAGLPPAAVEEPRLAVALAMLVRLVAREGEGEVLVEGRAGPGGLVRLELLRKGFEVPPRRSLAFALAQRVAEDAHGRFLVDRGPEGASLVLELAPA